MSAPIRGLEVRYFVGIAPTLGKTEYGELIKEYETTGKLPLRLKIKGMALDDLANANGWKVAPASLDLISTQLNDGVEIRKDHSNRIDDIIGKTTKGWKEGNQVFYEGEIADRGVIEKILLGYIKFDSIQVIAPDVFCLTCMDNGKNKDDVRIEAMDMPCPHCGSFALYIENPITLEMSLVTMPAYSNAETVPIGFKASLDMAMRARMKGAVKVTGAVTTMEPPSSSAPPMLAPTPPAVTTPTQNPPAVPEKPEASSWPPKCSNCGTQMNDDYNDYSVSATCPKCGAKVKGEQSEETKKKLNDAVLASEVAYLEASLATLEVLTKQTVYRAKDVLEQ